MRITILRNTIPFSLWMSYYIDTEHTDMRQLAFDVIQGVDLPGWKDVKSVDEIEISRVSGMLQVVVQ